MSGEGASLPCPAPIRSVPNGEGGKRRPSLAYNAKLDAVSIISADGNIVEILCADAAQFRAEFDAVMQTPYRARILADRADQGQRAECSATPMIGIMGALGCSMSGASNRFPPSPVSQEQVQRMTVPIADFAPVACSGGDAAASDGDA